MFVLRELGAQHLIYILEHTPDPHQPIPIMRKVIITLTLSYYLLNVIMTLPWYYNL
jgi:hypothetical protein